MKVKNKLRSGFGVLFVIVLFFGAVCLYYINQISDNAKNILKDNYETLNYCREMRTLLDENAAPLDRSAAARFEAELEKESHNLTEPGEAKAVAEVRSQFNKMQKTGTPSAERVVAERRLRHELLNIELLNMRAIASKNEAARASVDRSVTFLGLAGGFTFLVLFSFSVNFPGFIVEPLHKLLEGIRAVGPGNYRHRIHFDQNDEFAEVAKAFNDMTKRLNEWENSNLSQIMSDKLRIDTIIEQMNDAIIGVNERREILFINTSARRLLNIGPDKLDGRKVEDLARGNDLFMSILRSDHNPKQFKIVLDGRDSYFSGEAREIEVPNLDIDPAQPLKIAKAEAGKVFILKNITEFKERDEAKTNFIATISHELKTPISSIKMSLKLMKDERIGPINTEQQQLLEHITDDSDRLLKITSELLELSQAETGNIQLNFAAVGPEKIVDYAIAAVNFQAEQKGIRLELIKDEPLPQVTVDVEKTAWVLVNFLSNALRYSGEHGKVVISVKNKPGEVEFAVKDHGKGIDEQYQKRLFDRYFQVPTDGQNKSGSGLGLAISKDFIEAQNGKIWVVSAIGEGSTFGFTLPVTQQEPLHRA